MKKSGVMQVKSAVLSPSIAYICIYIYLLSSVIDDVLYKKAGTCMIPVEQTQMKCLQDLC